jgi:hypothetical protein
MYVRHMGVNDHLIKPVSIPAVWAEQASVGDPAAERVVRNGIGDRRDLFCFLPLVRENAKLAVEGASLTLLAERDLHGVRRDGGSNRERSGGTAMPNRAGEPEQLGNVERASICLGACSELLKREGVSFWHEGIRKPYPSDVLNRPAFAGGSNP